MPAMMLLWGVALVLATAATTFALHRKLTHGRGPEPDTIFWDVFAGLVVILPAILVPAVQWPPAALLMVFVAAATVAGSLTTLRRLDRIHAAEPRRRPGFAETTARHEHILTQWRRYELDPEQAIRYPAMTDVGSTQTAALARAIHDAEHCRNTAGTDYQAAVAHLEQALADAERAAGVPLAR